jgi:hypothetical protein
MRGTAPTPLTDTDLATQSVLVIPDVMDTPMADLVDSADLVVTDLDLVDSADTEIMDTVRSLSSTATVTEEE